VKTRQAIVTAALLLLVLGLAIGCSFLDSPPVASFTFHLSQRDPPCVVTLDASTSHDPDGIIVKYEWSFGDGARGTDRSTSHVYTTSGTYTITLVVTDDNGKTATVRETIVVQRPYNPAPTASFNASPPSGPAPLVVTFDATGSFGYVASYDWDFGDGNTGSGIRTSHTYPTAGTYTARLTVTNTSGATDSATQTIQVTAAPPPGGPHAALVASPTSGTAPLAVHFDASGSTAGQGSIVSYSWSFGDGTTGSGAAVSHTYPTAGTYAARLTVTNTSGATDSATQTIQVTEPGPPRPPVTFTGRGDSVTASFLLSKGLATFTIRHSGTSNFIVWLNGAAGEHVDLLVNVIGSYSGTALVGVGSGSLGASPGAHVLSVSADGDWGIQVQQPAYVSGATLPQSYGGSGDSVAGPFQLRDGLATFEITHTGQSNFIVWLYDTDGAPVDLLVNEIGSYSGTTLVGVRNGSIGAAPGVHVLEVIANGSWQIVVRQPQYTSGAALPWNCSGSGDNVTSSFNLPTGNIEFAFTHNGSSNFIVWLYGANGEAVDLLANEIGTYSGSKLVEVQAGSYGASPGVHVLSVRADGDWSVAVRRR